MIEYESDNDKKIYSTLKKYDIQFRYTQDLTYISQFLTGKVFYITERKTVLIDKTSDIWYNIDNEIFNLYGYSVIGINDINNIFEDIKKLI